MRKASPLITLAQKIRPAATELEGTQAIQLLMQAIVSLLMAPFVLIGLVWLTAVTDLEQISQHPIPFLLIFVSFLVMRQQTFNLYINLTDTNQIALNSSLASLVQWAVLLIFGPTMLWAYVLAASVWSVWNGRQLSRINRDPLWETLPYFTQEVGTSVFPNLVGLAVYTGLGGDFPLSGLAFADWLPALGALLVAALLPGILVLPIMAHINQLVGANNTLKNLAVFFVSAVAMSLFIDPFAILAALLYVQGGMGVLLFFVLGAFLVNLLAHHLSRTNERSEQRSRELAHLEALGQAIIQAPPDASTLRAMLAEHVSAMFPQDMVQIHLFGPGDAAPSGLVWPQFQVSHPPGQQPLDEALWEQLRQTENSHYVQPDVILPGMRAVYGDAVVVKITSVNPGQERAPTCLGGVYLLRRHTDGKTSHSLAALQALASQIASALYRAQVHVETLAHQKMTQELEFAGRIQASFLPSEIPQPAGWQIAAALEPARQTSGDFYDFIPLENGRLGILVADVADKGTGAALYMALSRTLIRTYAMQYAAQPELALAAANQRILSDTQTDQFVTVFYGVLDLDTGRLTYSNAGHNPAYLLRAHDKTVQSLSHTGIPLGMFEDMAWRQENVRLDQGDALLLYSDGVTEAQNAAGDLFDDQRLIAIGSAHLGQPAMDIQRAIINFVHEFVGEAPQFDDITLLVAVRQ